MKETNRSPLNTALIFALGIAVSIIGYYFINTPEQSSKVVEITGQQSDDLFNGLNHQAAQTVIDFHKAINSGDAEKVKALLAAAVLIYEGGGVESSAEEYASHHLSADIEFLSNMNITSLEHRIEGTSDMAVSVSRSQLKGSYKDKSIDMKTMETIVLKKFGEHWKIIHIHWSN